jgi:hypothetical protein
LLIFVYLHYYPEAPNVFVLCSLRWHVSFHRILPYPLRNIHMESDVAGTSPMWQAMRSCHDKEGTTSSGFELCWNWSPCNTLVNLPPEIHTSYQTVGRAFWWSQSHFIKVTLNFHTSIKSFKAIQGYICMRGSQMKMGQKPKYIKEHFLPQK